MSNSELYPWETIAEYMRPLIFFVSNEEYKALEAGDTTEIIELDGAKYNSISCIPERSIRIVKESNLDLLTSNYHRAEVDENSLHATITGFKSIHAMANYPAYNLPAVEKFPDMDATHAFIKIALAGGKNDG